MRKPRVPFAVAAFAFATIIFPATVASAFWLGPFHFGLSGHGHAHHHHYRDLHMRGRLHDLARHQERQRHQKKTEPTAREMPEVHRVPSREPPQPQPTRHGPAKPLLYPTSSLPTVFQNILWGPASTSIWPIGYETIFSSAFTPTPSEPDQCRQPVNANAIIEQLRTEIDPNTEQMSRLQRLSQAIDDAADRLAKSCPDKIPDDPIARLQLMLSQIEALTTAIDLIRQPLRNFEESLTKQQQAQLTAAASSSSTVSHGDVNAGIRSCAASSKAADRSVEEIGKSVQPSDDQRAAVDELHQALTRAAQDLAADCSTAVPQSASARLDTVEARLDATWRTILSVQVALYNFQGNLRADQQNRLKTMTFAAQD